MYGGFGLFGIFERLFPIIFGIIFLIFVSIMIMFLVRNISEWNSNNHAPVLTVEALVVSRRQEVSSHRRHNGQDMMDTYTSSTLYYATFQVESGDRIELSVSGKQYGMLAEGDMGKLTFQGRRYLGFERGSFMEKQV